MVTAVSSPNIALIKYWGNRDERLRLPAADSLSIVLDMPTVTVTAAAADRFSVESFHPDGSPFPQSEKSAERLKAHLALVRDYLKEIGRSEGFPEYVKLDIRSGIPPAIGIASSAAVFSALGEAYAGLVKGKPLSREDVSILSRLGSGSAARNSFGGYVALENHGEGMGSARGREVAPAGHWTLHDIIIVPSTEEKKVGSTDGHARAATSPLFAKRLKEIPARMKECEDAILQRDFTRLRTVSELDALEMHRIMETQDPPLRYLSDATHRILKEITSLRTKNNLDVLYTMDAGPTVHLICTPEALPDIDAFAASQKDCLVFRAKTGGASRLL
jgi:diphosphomevalonate decarboxylase